MRPRTYGDGDLCPEPGDHGPMYFIAARRQWCPVTQAIYDYDGVTLLRPGTMKSPTKLPDLNITLEGAEL